MSYRAIVFGVVSLAVVGCQRGSTPQPDNQRMPSPPATEVTPNNNANPGTPAPAAAPTETTAAASKVQLTDEQIALVTNDANSAEIEQAKLAEQKAKDPRVKRFASKMVKHHTEAKDKQAKLEIKTASSALSTDLEKSAGTTLADLKALSGAAFDTAYMNAQVDEHKKVLDTIDSALLPNVKSADLKAYLSDIRPTVEHHLKDAQNIQRNLTQTASAE